MSLTEVNLTTIVKKQYLHKLKSNKGMFTSLMATQLFAMLFSLGGTGGSGTSTEFYTIDFTQYTGNIIIAFTMIWAFASAIQITTRGYRYEDFTFVTNRLSSNLSNILFLITASFVGGVFAIMSSVLLKLIILLFYSRSQIIGELLTFNDFLLGIIVTFMYLLLLCAVGYLLGMLGQIHKVLVIFVVLFFAGILYRGDNGIGFILIYLFVKETSLIVFVTKVLLTALILFTFSTLLSDRLEVRK